MGGILVSNGVWERCREGRGGGGGQNLFLEFWLKSRMASLILYQVYANPTKGQSCRIFQEKLSRFPPIWPPFVFVQKFVFRIFQQNVGFFFNVIDHNKFSKFFFNEFNSKKFSIFLFSMNSAVTKFRNFFTAEFIDK